MSVWKRFIFLCLLLMTHPLSAFFGCNGPCDAFSGWFVGVNGGIAKNSADTSMFTSIQTQAPLSLQETFTAENHVYQLRPWGEAYGGWGWQFCWLYLGGRFGVNVSKFDPEAHFESAILLAANPDNVDFQFNTLETELHLVEYTLDFKPGAIFCNNTMVFALFGAAFNRQQLNGKARYVRDTDSDELRVRKGKCAVSLRGGIGVEHMFSPCVSVNLTYVYTSYKELRRLVVRETPIINEGFTALFKTEPDRHTVSTGLTLYF